MASYIGNELLEEIFARLPVKSLFRLKSTCKSWRSVIESTSFTEFHAQRCRFDNRLFFSRYEYKPSDRMKMYSTYGSSDALITTCGPLFDLIKCNVLVYGPLNNNQSIYLVIHRAWQYGRKISIATSKIALCNPATSEYKFANPFPNNMATLLSEIDRTPSLAHFGHYGFGFGSIYNQAGIVIDYKVVMFVPSGFRDGFSFGTFVCFLYSQKRGSWEKIADVRYGTTYSNNNKAVVGLVNERGEIETPFFILSNIVGCEQLFLNGSWHWLDVLPRRKSNNKYKTRVLAFDFANEVFRSIGGPPHDNLDSFDLDQVRCGVSLLNDHLVAIYLPHVNRCCVGIDMWMMMDYGVEGSWTKIYSCSNVFGRSLWSVVGLWYHIDSNIGIHRILLFDFHTRDLVSWDGTHAEVQDFRVREANDTFWNVRGMSSYGQTLHSLALTTENP